jgi:hypothetical protein
MTMNRDLFLSILAMDSYNRGYGAGISKLGETGQIGNAQLIARSEILGNAANATYQNWQSAGFYASAYDWNGETVISYRGTDNLVTVTVYLIPKLAPSIAGSFCRKSPLSALLGVTFV